MRGANISKSKRAILVAIVVVVAGIGLAIAALRPQSPPPAREEMVSGRVVDGGGRPVAGAEVGTSFRLAQSPEDTKLQISYADPPVLTDLNGEFNMPAASISYTKSLVAKKGRLLGFSIRKGTGPSEIKLGEPGQLDLRLTKRFGSKESIGADLLKQGSAIAYGTVAGSAVFAVPQGAFDLMLAEAEIVQTTRPLVFAGPVRKTLALELQPTSWARNLGKPAPAFTPTDLRNAKSVDPEALRGKWVLVDFWATWCLPCVQEMPKIISFYNEHAKDRGRFEIVAVHSPDGKSFEAIQSAYRSLVTKTWAGKDLPFPLVFDATGATQKRWGVEAYPTTLLIDPQGRLVGAATIDDLAKRL